MFLVFSHLTDPCFLASLLCSKKSLMFSDKLRFTYSGTVPWYPTEELAEVLNFNLSSLPHLRPQMEVNSIGIFLTGKSHPLRRQKKLASQFDSYNNVDTLTQLYYLWVLISRRTNNKLYTMNHLIKLERKVYLFWHNVGKVFP